MWWKKDKFYFCGYAYQPSFVDPANLACSKAPHLNHHKQIKGTENTIAKCGRQNAGDKALGYELWPRV